MTRLDRYLLREALPLLGFAVALYAVVGLLSNVLSRGQYLGGVNLLGLLRWLGLQVPEILAQTLPIALLMTVLLSVGRLVRENEWLVMQAGGISPLRASRFFLVGGLLFSGLSLLLSEVVVPWSSKQTSLAWWSLFGGGKGLFRLAGQDTTVGDYRLFFEGFDWANDTMQKVRIQRWEGNLTTVILAEQGKLVGKGLQLTDFKLYRLNLDALPVPELSTLPEVEGYLQQLIPAQNIGAAGATLTITLSQDRDQIVASNSGSGFGEQQPLSHWWKQLRTPTLAPKERLEARANLHSTLALALGNLVLLVLALPVAVGRASSPGIAFGLALMLSVGYYVLFSLGKVLALSGSLPPELAAWGTNLLALGVGWGLGKGIYR